MADLCSIDDVTDEGNILIELSEQKVSKINAKIKNLSLHIRGPEVAANSNLQRYNEDTPSTVTRENYYAWKACIYGTLVWMQKHEIIQAKDNIIAISEGKNRLQFSDKKEDKQTYQYQYERYIKLLTHTKAPVGSHIHRPPSTPGFSNGIWGPP